MILLTPGPLSTRATTRAAMMDDWGSRDSSFIALTAELRRRLVGIVRGEASHVAVPIQGSGTYAVEAAIATLMKPGDKLLVLVNGAYGERMASIAKRMGRQVEIMRWGESTPVRASEVAQHLAGDSKVSHVGLIHCETTTGILNPFEEISRVVAASGRELILDAMSSFGASDIHLGLHPVTAVIASSNKCLESVPGIGLAIIEKSALSRCKGNSASTSLDLHEQWLNFERNGQWRFTPPVQVVAATVEALGALEREGGPPARLARYRENFSTLVAGMRKLGFELYLEESLHSPVIATFRTPKLWPGRDIRFDFETFYLAIAERGFLLYPGKLADADTFRIGCIGNVFKTDIEALLRTIAAILEAAPAAAHSA